MSNHVFKIKFTKPSIELADDYERLSDNDKLKISELEVLSSYDYDDIEDYENYNCIMIAPPLIIASYRRILQENMIKHDCIDITDADKNSPISPNAFVTRKTATRIMASASIREIIEQFFIDFKTYI